MNTQTSEAGGGMSCRCAVRYGFQSPRGWLVISNRSSLIGIWPCESQSPLLIHPNRIHSLAIKATPGSFKHMFLYRWIYLKTEATVSSGCKCNRKVWGTKSNVGRGGGSRVLLLNLKVSDTTL